MALSVIAIVHSAREVKAAEDQAIAAREQTKDLMNEFNLSGATLSAETGAQLRYNDNRREPETRSEEQHPTLTPKDFDTADEVYILYKIQNTGRLDSVLISADLRVGSKVVIKTGYPAIRTLVRSPGWRSDRLPASFHQPAKTLTWTDLLFLFSIERYP